MKNFRMSVAVAAVATLSVACGPGGDPPPGQCPEVMCTLFCENGFQRGADGCEVCACEGGSSSSSSSGSSGTSGSTGSSSGVLCPPVMCDLYCEFGFAQDENGCSTCSCVPGACSQATTPEECSGISGCTPVFTATTAIEPSQDQGGAPRTTEGFQCCTVLADGTLSCGEEPPPPQGCWSDADCSRGQVCDTVNFCESACPPDSEGACPAVCLGRCVEEIDACFGAWTDQFGNCRGPADGVLPAECCGTTNLCAVTLCVAGTTCVECSPAEDCVVKCVEDVSACAAVDCGPGAQCVACGPNEDCLAKCVATTDDCRSTGCGEGERCSEITSCNGGCACPADSPYPCECAYPGDDVTCTTEFACVPFEPIDCRQFGCAEGETCEPSSICTYECGCAADDANCQCDALPPVCTDVFECRPAVTDPCNALDETQCAYDHDLCSPVYVQACPECVDQGCLAPCQSQYAGCFSVDALPSDGGRAP